MDGKRAERTKILTHFESDYGAAPKVEMKLGQVFTNLVPDFACKKWVGFEGKIVGNPFLDICRSQIDVRIEGDCAALLQEMKGFHWMMSYGNFMRDRLCPSRSSMSNCTTLCPGPDLAWTEPDELNYIVRMKAAVSFAASKPPRLPGGGQRSSPGKVAVVSRHRRRS
jgi:hypothetical protein